MPTSPTSPLHLTLTPDPAAAPDPEALSAAALSLARELRDSGLADATPAGAGPAPGGKSGGEAIAVGALLAAVLPATVPALIAFLKDWMLRNRPLKIKLQVGGNTLEVEGYDPAAMTEAELGDLIVALRRQIEAK